MTSYRTKLTKALKHQMHKRTIAKGNTTTDKPRNIPIAATTATTNTIARTTAIAINIIVLIIIHYLLLLLQTVPVPL